MDLQEVLKGQDRMFSVQVYMVSPNLTPLSSLICFRSQRSAVNTRIVCGSLYLIPRCCNAMHYGREELVSVTFLDPLRLKRFSCSYLSWCELHLTGKKKTVAGGKSVRISRVCIQQADGSPLKTPQALFKRGRPQLSLEILHVSKGREELMKDT